MHTIVEIIQALRDPPYRLSQTEISRRTGVHQTKISRWAGGAIPAGADDALKLQSLLHKVKNTTNPAQATTDSVAQGVA